MGSRDNPFSIFLIFKSKRAISPVVATALLLVVAVSSVVYFQGWFINFQSSLFSQLETKVSDTSVTIEYLEPDKLYVRNYNSINLSVNDVKIGGKSCGINGSIGQNGVYSLDLGLCLIGSSVGPKEVVLITKNGVFTQTKMLKLTLTSTTSVLFNLGTTCSDISYSKIYALESISDSHAENRSSNLYTYSACIKDSIYSLSNSCSGNYTVLFSLDNSSNAHVFTNKTSSYDVITSWQDVCVSNNGGSINSTVSSTDPYGNSICLGSIEQIDNVLGSHMGDCSAYANKIWLKIG